MAVLATVLLIHPDTGREIIVNASDVAQWRSKGYLLPGESKELVKTESSGKKKK